MKTIKATKTKEIEEMAAIDEAVLNKGDRRDLKRIRKKLVEADNGMGFVKKLNKQMKRDGDILGHDETI